MNRKIFALLLLLPVVLMAMDKLTTNSDEGGDRQKKKTEAKQGSATTALTKAAPAQSVQMKVEENTPAIQPNQPVAQAKQPGTEPENKINGLSHKELVTEMKAMLEASFDPMSEYTNYEGHVRLYDESISEEVRNFIQARVVDKLESANPVAINLERSFSRCPSGYHVALLANDGGTLTNEGWMVVDDGCWDRPVAKFRYDVDAKMVEGYVNEKVGYLALDTFFKLYKEAAKV